MFFRKAHHRLSHELLEDRLCLTVVTFESLPATGQPGGTHFPSTSFSVDGFVVAVGGSLPTLVHSPGHCDPDCPENGGQYLRTQVDGVLTITEEGNHTFALHSLQVAESFKGIREFWAGQVDIKGIRPNGDTVVTSLRLDGIQDGFGPMDDFQTFILPSEFEELTAVQLSGSGGVLRDDFSIDNISVIVLPNTPDPSDADPDPAVLEIAAIMEEIHSLDLHHGIENSLLKKLEGTQDKLLDGTPKNDRAATGKLNAFTNQVRAQSGKKIHSDEATNLIAAVDLVIGSLESDQEESLSKNRGPFRITRPR